MITDLISIFERDLDRLKKEVQSFRNKQNLWETTGKVTNSAGNLTLHLIGNLNHFIGHLLGETNYKRNREGEFSSKNVPIEQLVSDIDDVSQKVTQTLLRLDIADLNKPYPVEVFGFEMTTAFMLMHLSSHLNYHLGQINYIRRIIDEA